MMMKTLNRLLAVLAMLALVGSGQAFAHAPEAQGLRLIQTGTQAPQWMTSDQIAELSRRAHGEGRCGGFIDITQYPNDEYTVMTPFALFERELSQQPLVEKLINEVSTENLYKTVQKLESIPTRYYQSDSAVQAIDWLATQYKTIAGARTDVEIEKVTHRFKMPSLIVRIRGNGPRASESIVLGGHADSIQAFFGFPNASGRAPGADDDASGTATVLEVFRVLVESGYRPDRTLEFMAYAGEELGLLGSQDIAQRYRTQGRKVMGVMQFDMTFYPGAGKQIGVISDYVNPQLTDFMIKLIETYVKLPWTRTQCGYECSDHASWNRAGYPAVFPFEATFDASNSKIHTPDDLLSSGLDAEFGSHFAKLGVAFAIELSKEPEALARYSFY